ncbi:carbamate kinase [Micromonosporaceae bacterium Da 78-11]
MVALGGNAMLERGEKPDALIQRHHVQHAARALAPIAARHQLIVCHGNGPQVGVLAIESEADQSLSQPFPLDVLVAQTQGMIGYWLAQELRNAAVHRPIVALVTQTVVDDTDPAFTNPTKFIGPHYTPDRARQLAAQHGWAVAADAAADWRRVVASPLPRRIVEIETISRLVDAGVLVICGGGGGAPVVEDTTGLLTGVEAVVDKDYVAARIALDLHADRLILLTDVPAVMHDFGTPTASSLRHLTAAQAAGLHLAAGSMGPKIAACAQFTAATGHPSAIGALSDAAAVVAGTAGTTITSDTGAEAFDTGPPALRSLDSRTHDEPADAP